MGVFQFTPEAILKDYTESNSLANESKKKANESELEQASRSSLSNQSHFFTWATYKIWRKVREQLQHLHWPRLRYLASKVYSVSLLSETMLGVEHYGAFDESSLSVPNPPPSSPSFSDIPPSDSGSSPSSSALSAPGCSPSSSIPSTGNSCSSDPPPLAPGSLSSSTPSTSPSSSTPSTGSSYLGDPPPLVPGSSPSSFNPSGSSPSITTTPSVGS